MSELEYDVYLLTPTQSSEIVGVPVVQLLRWAVLGQGPRNSGTKRKPLYTEEDLEAWKAKRNMQPSNAFAPNPQR